MRIAPTGKTKENMGKQKKTIWFFSGFLLFSFVFLIGPKGTTTIGRTHVFYDRREIFFARYEPFCAKADGVPVRVDMMD